MKIRTHCSALLMLLAVVVWSVLSVLPISSALLGL